MSINYNSNFNLYKQWSYSFAHFKECFTKKNSSILNRIQHLSLGLIDFIPVVGTACSLIEKK